MPSAPHLTSPPASGWARMEMKLIRTRTLAGLKRARAAGKKLGGPRLDAFSKPADLLKAWKNGDSWATLAEGLGVSPATVRRRRREAVQAEGAA